MFYVGQKVVCIDDKPDPLGRPIWVKKDEIYTISDIFFWCHCMALRLTEAPSNFNLIGWKSDMFRPIVEKKTDISIFTALLNPANHKHLEDA